MDNQNWPSKRSFKFLIFSILFGLDKKLGQFGIMIKNDVYTFIPKHKNITSITSFLKRGMSGWGVFLGSG
jgi:hypothetical protein